MQVCNVIVEGAVVLQRVGGTIGIVEEVQGVAAIGFSQKLITGIIISVDNSIDCLGQPLAVRIVGESNLGVSGFCPVQLLACTPLKGPPGTIIVAGGVADDALGSVLESENSRTSLS